MIAKQKKGRPLGSKNKKSREREQQDKQPSTKGKGRVPGSRNKTTTSGNQILAAFPKKPD